MENIKNTQNQRALFAMAHTDIHSLPFGNHGRTMRLVVEANAVADSLWVRFSNRCGTRPVQIGAASLALCDADGTLESGALFPLTAGGVLAFAIPPGEELLSDTVRFPLLPGQHFALNLYYPENDRIESGNWIGEDTLRSKPGNFSADLELSGKGIVSRLARTVVAADLTSTTSTVAQIVANCPEAGNVVACFGDSITQQSNWTRPLQKVLHHRYPGAVTLCNLGIGGNRLLRDSAPNVNGLYGPAGIDRFAQDVLALPGLTHCILELGTNDIGLPGTHGAPDSDMITAAQFAAAMERLCAQLHEKGVLAYGCTLCPRPITGVYDEAREAVRQQMNEWIRTADCYDAVLDFDAVLRREDGQCGMAEGFALPDGLHPSPLGGMVMAKSIDPALFGEVRHG